MGEKCDTANEWKFCPYCGYELHRESGQMLKVRFNMDGVTPSGHVTVQLRGLNHLSKRG